MVFKQIFRLIVHLDDFTDRGHEWRFYEQAEIIDYDDWKSDDIFALPPNLQFRKFQGLFGNTKEIGCAISGPIIGVQYKLEYGILLGRRQKYFIFKFYSIFEFPFYEVKLGR